VLSLQEELELEWFGRPIALRQRSLRAIAGASGGVGNGSNVLVNWKVCEIKVELTLICGYKSYLQF